MSNREKSNIAIENTLSTLGAQMKFLPSVCNWDYDGDISWLWWKSNRSLKKLV